MAITRRGFFGAVAAALGVASGAVKLPRKLTLHEQYLQGRMSRMDGFPWHMDENLTTQKKWEPGDMFIIEGRNSINPKTGEPTDWPVIYQSKVSCEGDAYVVMNCSPFVTSDRAEAERLAPRVKPFMVLKESLHEPQRRYNYAVSKVAEQVALAPRAPWVG